MPGRGQGLRNALSRCLVPDPFHPSGATHDVDPFGVYQTGEDGTVVFKQVLRAAPVYVKCRTPEDLDALVARVFLTAAKHARRHMAVTDRHASSFFSRVGARAFSGSAREGLMKDAVVTRALPENVVPFVRGDPEDVGRLCYHCGAYGVSLMNPGAVASIEIVPTPFGFGECLQEVVG